MLNGSSERQAALVPHLDVVLMDLRALFCLAQVGYCQGMNFLAGVLLMYLPSEADAYGALVVLMQHRRLRELYKEDLAWLQVLRLSRTRPLR